MTDPSQSYRDLEAIAAMYEADEERARQFEPSKSSTLDNANSAPKLRVFPPHHPSAA